MIRCVTDFRLQKDAIGARFDSWPYIQVRKDDERDQGYRGRRNVLRSEEFYPKMLARTRMSKHAEEIGG